MKKRWLNIGLLPFLLFTLLLSCSHENIEEIPEATKNKDTVLHLAKSNVDKVEPLTAIFASLGKLEMASSYQKNVETTMVLTKDMVIYTPRITGLEIKNNDAYYQEMYTESTLFSYRHIAYEKNNKVAIQSDEEYYCVLSSDYATYYGALPSKLLSPYVLNQTTIASISKNKENDGTYSFVMELNSSATTLLQKQKEKLDNIKSTPVYDAISLTLKMKEDFTPISYKIKSEYVVDISSYSQMKCQEISTANFSRYQENIAIPNGAKLEATLYENTRDILNRNQNQYTQKLMIAFMKLDFKNGVLFDGRIPSEENEKGSIKLHVKMDLLNFSKDPFSAFEGQLELKINEENILITYKDSVVYILYKEKKLAFNVEMLLQIMTTISTLDASTMEQNFEVEKVNGLEDTYRIILKKDVLSSFDEVIRPLAQLIGITLKSPSLEMLVQMPNDNIQQIRLQLKNDDVSYGINFAVSNQKYIAPSDLDTYVSKIEKSYQVQLSLDALKNSSEEDEEKAIDGKIYFGIDVLESRIEDMLKFTFDFNLASSITKLLNQLTLSSQVPEDIKKLKDVNLGRILYSNGELYILMYKDTELRYFKEVSLMTSSLNLQDKKSALSSIVELLSFVYFSKTDESSSISLPGILVNTILEKTLEESLSEMVYHRFGKEMGYVINSLLELYKPLDHIELSLSHNKEKASMLQVWKKDVQEDEVYDEEKNYDVIASISLSLLPLNEKEEDFSFDILEEISLEEKASMMRNKIASLNANFALTDEYYQQLVKVNNEYQSLSSKVKALVYNGEVQGYFYNELTTENLLKRYQNQKQEVDDFIKEFNDKTLENMIETIDLFTKAQKNYLKKNYVNEWEVYYQKRMESEVESIEKIKEGLASYQELDLEAATLEEVYDQYMLLCKIQDQVNQCLDDSLANLDLTSFNSYSQKVYHALVNKFIDYVDSSIKRIKDKDSTAFSSLEAALLFQKEMEEHYQKFYKEIVSSSLYYLYQSDTTAYALDAEYLNYMRLYNPNGWEANCIDLIENAISEVIQNNETDQEKINQIQEALSYVHTKNISNYNEWVEYLAK